MSREDVGRQGQRQTTQRCGERSVVHYSRTVIVAGVRDQRPPAWRNPRNTEPLTGGVTLGFRADSELAAAAQRS
jgi:hypothetical protein